MKILVTGGAGFIGSNVVDAYIEAGHKVAIIDNLSNGKTANLNPKAKFYKIDIGSPKITDIFKSFKPEIVNHLAAQIDVRRSCEDPSFDANINIIGGLNLLQNCVKHSVKKVVFSSTGGAIYGEIKDKNGADEKHFEQPICPYAISKKAIELYLHAFYVNHGLTYTILRYANVFGDRQDPLGEAGVIAIFIGKMLSNEVLNIYGDGKQLRDYTYVKDVARANLIALDSGDNKIYNIGTGTGTSVNTLFKILKKITGYTKEANYATARTGELWRSVLNAQKIKKEQGWSPEVSIEEGLKKTVSYFRKV